MNRTPECPPCNGACEQGRRCPARSRLDLRALIGVTLIVALVLAWVLL